MPTPLTDDERTAAREYGGYGAYGPGPGDASFNRYSVSYETLEYRLSNLTTAELVIARDHLAACAAARLAWRGGTDNLDTNQAAIWHRNPREMAERRAYYGVERRDLCAFLGVPAGPALASGGNTMSLVV